MNPFNYKWVNNGSMSPKRGPNKLKIAWGPVSNHWSKTLGVIGLMLQPIALFQPYCTTKLFLM